MTPLRLVRSFWVCLGSVLGLVDSFWGSFASFWDCLPPFGVWLARFWVCMIGLGVAWVNLGLLDSFVFGSSVLSLFGIGFGFG